MTIDKQRVPSLREVDEAIARWMYPDVETVYVESSYFAFYGYAEYRDGFKDHARFTQSLDAQIPVLERLELKGKLPTLLDTLCKYCQQKTILEFNIFLLTAPAEVRARAISEVIDDEH